MSASMSIKGFASRTTTVVFDLMHGGLLMAGVILTLILAAFVAGNPQIGDGLRALRQSLPAVGSIGTAEAAVEPPESATGSTQRLGSDLRPVLDSVAKRYRVSASALEPVFLTAHTTGRELNLDPLLIVAVIAIESRFNPLSESVVGAQGLMQIMPRYHQDKLPANADALALFQPELNVSIGARILKESISRMGGLTAGLQQFAGALDDPDESYATKVLAEKQKLEAAAKRGRSSNG